MVNFTQIEKSVYEIEKNDGMNVSARIFANEKLLSKMKTDRTMTQLTNVAKLPGICNYSAVMPDGHEGYGFPIGGVGAFDENDGGVISPGGVGYDINCGVRLLTTELTIDDINANKRQLVEKLFVNVPSGVGVKGKLRLEENVLETACTNGVNWAVEQGYGRREDVLHTEENGCMSEANWDVVSKRAKKRGKGQIGTLGAGNHFLEIQRVDDIILPDIAAKFGLKKDQIVVMIHSGSRGFGHQVCDDSIKIMMDASRKYNINLPDRELCCAPLDSNEAIEYFEAMSCAVNFAFCNRQLMMHWTRETFDQIFGTNTSDSMNLVYDVCHNIAKKEEHVVDGKKRKLCVHRKGATRSFAPGRSELPSAYRETGQPVIIPGSMGTASYCLVGAQGAMDKTFGSACHGAGRLMSRGHAKHSWKGEDIARELASRNILVKSNQLSLISEEAPGAYKDVDEVVSSVQDANLANIVAKMIPLAVVKG